MQIAALDLMPLLWGLCVLLSAALFFYGERAAPSRTVPAAIAALVLYFFDYPPRFQVIVFLVLYVISAAVYATLAYLRRLIGRRKPNEETISLP